MFRTSPSLDSCAAEDEGYFMVGNDYLYMDFTRKTADNAQANCKSLGGHLLEVTVRQTSTSCVLIYKIFYVIHLWHWIEYIIHPSFF